MYKASFINLSLLSGAASLWWTNKTKYRTLVINLFSTYRYVLNYFLNKLIAFLLKKMLWSCQMIKVNLNNYWKKINGYRRRQWYLRKANMVKWYSSEQERAFLQIQAFCVWCLEMSRATETVTLQAHPLLERKKSFSFSFFFKMSPCLVDWSL